MPAAQKDTIYVDIDDEITAVIDKLDQSEHKIVAFVLPKRAPVFQSLVNLKLLKRSADDAKKSIVLITSEAGVMPLAGAVGVHVAKTLQSKPAIPVAPAAPTDRPDTIALGEEPALDPKKSVGELSGQPIDDLETETIELDDPVKVVGAVEATKRSKLNKKLKIPNFSKFRLRLFLGIFALILLLVGWFMATSVLPKANITIKTDTENITSTINFVASPTLKAFDEEDGIVPATSKELKKTQAEKAPATGQKDVGEKAKGTMRFINCSITDKLSDTVRTIPAGTGVSSGNFTFITTEAVDVEPSSYTGNVCQKNKKSSAVDVVAQNGGDSYNLGARGYTVAGFSTVSGEGSDMSGGTSRIVKTVSQQDIDTAKQRASDKALEGAKEALVQQLQAQNLIALVDTFAAGTPQVTNTPNSGDEASEVTATATVTYTMLGVNQEDIKKLIEVDVKDEVDPIKQIILNNGLDKSIYQIGERKPNGDVSFSLQTVVVAGPQLDAEAIKNEIAGKKRGEAQSIIQARPGIKDVEISYSPFWVLSTPKKTSKITINFDQTATETNSDETDNEEETDQDNATNP